MVTFKSFGLILSLVVGVISMSCHTQKWSDITTGVSGYVSQTTGNQMPDPNEPVSTPPALEATVYVYELTPVSRTERIGSSAVFLKVNTRLIDSVASDKKGYYQLALPAGVYSLFVKRDNGYFANSFDGENNVNPITVEDGKVTRLDVVVNNKATY